MYNIFDSNTNEDIDTNPEIQSNVQNLFSEARTVDEQLNELKDYIDSKPSWWEPDSTLVDILSKGAKTDTAGNADAREDLDLYPDDETPQSPDTNNSANPQSEQMVDSETDFDLTEALTADDSLFDDESDGNTASILLDDDGEDGEDVEEYNQTAPSSSSEESSAGSLSFSDRGKSYEFDVVSTYGNNFGNSISGNRTARYRGRRLEIRDKRGNLFATYYPYTGRFDFDNRRSKQSARWYDTFKRTLNSQLNDYLRNAGLLDSSGNLIPDGNDRGQQQLLR